MRLILPLAVALSAASSAISATPVPPSPPDDGLSIGCPGAIAPSGAIVDAASGVVTRTFSVAYTFATNHDTPAAPSTVLVAIPNSAVCTISLSRGYAFTQTIDAELSSQSDIAIVDDAQHIGVQITGTGGSSVEGADGAQIATSILLISHIGQKAEPNGRGVYVYTMHYKAQPPNPRSSPW